MTAGALKILITTDAVGGVWQYSIDLAQGLTRRGIDVLLVTLGPRPSIAQKTHLIGLPNLTLIETDLALEWMAKEAAEVEVAATKLNRLARVHGADLIHLNSPALAAFLNADVPVVAVQHSCVATWWASVRGTDLPDDFVWRADLIGKGLHAADATIAPSVAFAQATAKMYGLDECPTVIPNGRAPAQAHVSVAVAPFVFTAGRLWDDGKNIAGLNEAARHVSVQVLAAGSLQNPNGELKDFPHLQCLGGLPDEGVASLLAKQPIYVSTALYEPFGLAVLEAAQAGCALVLSDIPTFRELWGDAAFFVAADDVFALVRAIEILTSDPNMRMTMGLAAKGHAERYSVDRMVDAICCVYRKLQPSKLIEKAA